MKVKKSISKFGLPTPNFFLLDRGKSLPRLHKARIEAKASRLGMTLKPAFPHQAHAAKLHSGWADEASSGTHPGRAFTSSLGQDTEERVGEALERPPLIDLGEESQTLTEEDP